MCPFIFTPSFPVWQEPKLQQKSSRMGNQITNTITEILSDEPYVPSEVPTQNQLNVLRELQKQLASKPAPDCQEDIALFRDLWEAAGGESGEFVLESDFWKDRFGFQSQKPLSDVRGGGRLR